MATGDEIQGVAERFLWSESSGGARWKIFLTGFITRVVLVILALGAIWGVWRALKPERPAIDRARLDAANRCAAAIRQELQSARGDCRTLVCVPFAGDSTGAPFEATRDALVSSGTFDVCGKSFAERVRAIFDLRSRGSNDAERAARRARRVKADGALVGSVSRFETVDGRAALVVDYRLIDAATGRETFAGRYDSTKEETLTPEKPAASLAIQEPTRSFWENFALWGLVVLTIPLLSFRALEVATSKRSNGANAFALTACFLVDAACAWLLLRPTFEDATSIFGALIAGLFALWYDAQVLRLAHRRTVGA